MNIDFHYGVVYIVARVAGMNAHDAEIVAHASQYVDDATVSNRLEFAGGEVFDRFASAHAVYDYRNLDDQIDRAVWVPFHFLPGGEGDSPEEKAICVKNSTVAADMVRNALSNERRDNALHRLGVTLHTYVDTWAHQKFSGIISDVNAVKDLRSTDHNDLTILTLLKKQFKSAVVDVAGRTIDGFCRLGHGAALHFPDIPWAQWEYTNGFGEHVERNNLPEFLDAADWAHRVVRAFLRNTSEFETETGLPEEIRTILGTVLSERKVSDENIRLELIRIAFSQGRFPGYQEEIPAYVSKGASSWKATATGVIDDDDGRPAPTWKPEFETSDYRLVHDAIVEHRFDMTRTILPAHGVRLA
jgi:hypothetical protein